MTQHMKDMALPARARQFAELIEHAEVTGKDGAMPGLEPGMAEAPKMPAGGRSKNAHSRLSALMARSDDMLFEAGGRIILHNMPDQFDAGRGSATS